MVKLSTSGRIHLIHTKHCGKVLGNRHSTSVCEPTSRYQNPYLWIVRLPSNQAEIKNRQNKKYEEWSVFQDKIFKHSINGS